MPSVLVCQKHRIRGHAENAYRKNATFVACASESDGQSESSESRESPVREKTNKDTVSHRNVAEGRDMAELPALVHSEDLNYVLLYSNTVGSKEPE